MSTEKNFWKSVNPFVEEEWPGRFYAMWIGLAMVSIVSGLSAIIASYIVSGDYQSLLFWTIFTATTLTIWVKTRKFIYIKRKWWQSLMMYGSFWCILFTGMILSMLVAKYFGFV